MDSSEIAPLRSKADALIQFFESDSDFQIFREEHPTQSRLVMGILVRIRKLTEICSVGRLNTEEFLRETGEVSLIGRRLFSPETPVPQLSEAESASAAVSYLQLGLPLETVSEFFAGFRKNPKGRPATKKHVAVLAHEQKVLNPHWTWGQLADRMCIGVSPARECEVRKRKDRHQLTTPCCQALRQSVEHLDKFLQDYNM
jgi:hypothetical protein